MPSVRVARRVSEPEACAGARRVRPLARKVTMCSTCGPERFTTLYEMPGTIDVVLPAAAPLVGTGVTAPAERAGARQAAARAAGMRARRMGTGPFKPEPPTRIRGSGRS